MTIFCNDIQFSITVQNFKSNAKWFWDEVFENFHTVIFWVLCMFCGFLYFWKHFSIYFNDLFFPSSKCLPFENIWRSTTSVKWQKMWNSCPRKYSNHSWHALSRKPTVIPAWFFSTNVHILYICRTAKNLEDIVRKNSCVPATVAILDKQICVGRITVVVSNLAYCINRFRIKRKCLETVGNLWIACESFPPWFAFCFK